MYMSKVKVIAFSVSLDGFGAGPNQNLDNPLGTRGHELHTWMHPTKTFHKIIGKDGGTEGIDNDLAENSFEDIGAWIIGEICLDLFAGNGKMKIGKAGGAKILRIMFPYLY